MNSTETQFAHSFIKKPGEKIQVALRRFKGKYYVDLRLWFQEEAGKFLPSRKGVSFDLEHLPEFRRGIDELAKAAGDIKPENRNIAPESSKQMGRFNKLYSNQRSE